MPALPVTIFADFSCPASYLAETALRGIDGYDLAFDFRAFELYPEPAVLDPIRFSREEWAGLDELAADLDLTLSRPRSRPRTGKAHEAARYARERGSEVEFRREIFAACWRDGRDIGRIDVLADLAAGAGFDADDLRIALDIDRYRDEVLRDGALARRLRVPGTPTIYVGKGSGARVLAGARGPDELRALLDEFARDPRDPIIHG